MIHARKQGRVCTVFMDNDRPLPITKFEEEPMGFPVTMSEEQIRAQWPGQEIKFFEPPKEDQPEANDVLAGIPPAQLERMIADVKGKAAETVKPVAVPQAVFPQQQDIISALVTKLHNELRILFTRYGEATGKRKAQLKVELEAICNFLLKIDPTLATQIKSLKEELDAPRFEL